MINLHFGDFIAINESPDYSDGISIWSPENPYREPKKGKRRGFVLFSSDSKIIFLPLTSSGLFNLDKNILKTKKKISELNIREAHFGDTMNDVLFLTDELKMQIKEKDKKISLIENIKIPRKHLIPLDEELVEILNLDFKKQYTYNKCAIISTLNLNFKLIKASDGWKIDELLDKHLEKKSIDFKKKLVFFRKEDI